jgi:hypothetical protein
MMTCGIGGCLKQDQRKVGVTVARGARQGTGSCYMSGVRVVGGTWLLARQRLDQCFAGRHTAASTGRPSSSCRLDKLSSRARNDAMRAPVHNRYQGKAHGDKRTGDHMVIRATIKQSQGASSRHGNDTPQGREALGLT